MTTLLCAGCQRSITGSYIQAFDQAWHPDCFRCARCGQPIREQRFNVQDNHPYHPDCYQQAFGLHCAACGGLTQDQYVEQDGQAYHPDCHKHQFGKRCAVCGEIIEGHFVQNFWGDAYCARHQTEYPMCYVCQRPVCQRLTGGGVRYNDGRVLCHPCRVRAVDEVQQARMILEEVQERMAHYGLDTRQVSIPLEMVSLKRLVKGDMGDVQARLRGQTKTKVKTVNGQEVSRSIEALYVLGGLPPEYLENVLGHELGHVWLFMQRIDALPKDLEEGLCNLFAYLLHQEKVSPEYRHCIHLLEEDPDPVYGEGFRRARAVYERIGMPALLRWVTQHRGWPHE